jgi:hypothetical protein
MQSRNQIVAISRGVCLSPAAPTANLIPLKDATYCFDKLFKRLFGSQATVYAWRGFHRAITEQDDRDLRTDRSQTMRHVKAGMLRQVTTKHNASSRIHKEEQRDGLRRAAGGNNVIAHAFECIH